MTDAAVMAAISALSKKVDGIGGSGNEVLDLDVTYTTVGNRYEGLVTQEYSPFTGVWQHTSDNTNPLPTVGTAMIGDDIYYIGGSNGNNITAECFKYNVVTGEVTKLPSYPGNSGNGMAFVKVVEFQGKLACMGGTNYKDFNGNVKADTYVYDPATNIWTSHPNMSSAQVVGDAFVHGSYIFTVNAKYGNNTDYLLRKNFTSSSESWSYQATLSGSATGCSAKIGDILYVFPGTGSNVWSVNLNNPSTPVAKAAAPIPFQFGKVAVVGTIIYLMQSENSSANYPKVYAYDTVADTWTAKADIPLSTKGGRVFTNGTTKIWMAMQATNGPLYEYDVSGDSWTQKTSAGKTLNSRSPAHMSGTDVFIPSTVDASFMKYDTLTDEWSVVFSSPQLRGGGSVTVGDKIYYFGGYDVNNVVRASSMVYDTTTRVWKSLAPMTGNVAGSAVTHVNGKIYVMGGYNGSSYVNSNRIYDIATNTWSTGANRLGTSLISASVGADGKIYAGTNDRYVRIYDPVADSWTSSSQGSYNASVCAVLGDNVYLVTTSYVCVWNINSNTWAYYQLNTYSSPNNAFVYDGNIYVTVSDRILRLDLDTPEWSFVTSYNTSGYSSLMFQAGSATLVGDALYFVGPSGYSPMSKFYISRGEWNSAAPLSSTPLGFFGTASYEDSFYTVGGRSTTNPSSAVNNIYRYSASNNKWEATLALPTPVSNPAVAIYKGRMFVFGGVNGSNATTSGVREYYLSSTANSAKGDMPSSHADVYAATCGDYIYVLISSSIFEYSPTNDSWRMVGYLSGGLPQTSSAGMVSDGEYVYFLGSGSQFRRFDPETFEITSLPAMLRSRYTGSSVYFDGKIYVSGGHYANDVYDIASESWSTLSASTTQRVYGGMGLAGEKIISLGGYEYGTSSLYSALVPEAFSPDYRVDDPLAITEAGIYHSMTPGLTLDNVSSGRSGDSVAIAPGHEVYARGPAVDKRMADNIEVLKT